MKIVSKKKMQEKGLSSYYDTPLDVIQGVGGVAQIKVVTLS
jgi:hypothetical protein